MFLHLLNLFLVPSSSSHYFNHNSLIFLFSLDFVPNNHLETVEKGVKVFNIIVPSKHLNDLLISYCSNILMSLSCLYNFIDLKGKFSLLLVFGSFIIFQD